MHNLQNGRIEDKPIPITWEFGTIKEFEAFEQAIEFVVSVNAGNAIKIGESVEQQ